MLLFDYFLSYQDSILQLTSFSFLVTSLIDDTLILCEVACRSFFELQGLVIVTLQTEQKQIQLTFQYIQAFDQCGKFYLSVFIHHGIPLQGQHSDTFKIQIQKICFLSTKWYVFVCRNFIGEQVDYNSQMLENIQYQLSNHPMILDNSLFYDVFGHDGAPGAPGQVLKVYRYCS